jgi:hypothetical protein
LALIQPSPTGFIVLWHSAPVDLAPSGGFLGAGKVPDRFRIGR